MSQALMDYVTARHEVFLAVLEMLTAEQRLSDEYSSVLDVTSAQDKAQRAARTLTEAVDALPAGRRPVGWSEPPSLAGNLPAPRQRFIKATLRCLSAEYAGPSGDADADAEYAEDQLALAARNLAADADAERAAKAEAGGRLL